MCKISGDHRTTGALFFTRNTQETGGKRMREQCGPDKTLSTSIVFKGTILEIVPRHACLVGSRPPHGRSWETEDCGPARTFRRQKSERSPPGAAKTTGPRPNVVGLHTLSGAAKYPYDAPLAEEILGPLRKLDICGAVSILLFGDILITTNS